MKVGEAVMEFEEIYSKYFRDVYKYVLCLSKNASVAEDITQEAFFKALKSIDTFNGNCKMSVWLCQIAKNSYFTYLKKEGKSYESIEGALGILDNGFEEEIIAEETSVEINKLIQKLEKPYKDVFILRFEGELSFFKIAELFGKTESWARVTYHRAKIKLKENLR